MTYANGLPFAIVLSDAEEKLPTIWREVHYLDRNKLYFTVKKMVHGFCPKSHPCRNLGGRVGYQNLREIPCK